MVTFLRAALAATLLSSPHTAAAQTVALSDPAPPHVELWGHAGWLSVDRGDAAPAWDRWHDVAEFGLSGALFLNRHLKIEFGAATSTEANAYREVRVRLPGQLFDTGFSQELRYRASTLSTGVSWQFLDSRWIHPVVSAGVATIRKSEEARSPFYPPPVNPPPGAFLPAGTVVSWRANPYVSGGFKFYASERAFLRTDVRTTFARGGVSQVSWRSGVGIDF